MGRLLATLRHPGHVLAGEAHHLRDIEREGDAGSTPAIVLMGIFLFLIPIFVVIAGVTFAVYYLT